MSNHNSSRTKLLIYTVAAVCIQLLPAFVAATCTGDPPAVPGSTWNCRARTATGAVCTGTCDHASAAASAPGPTALCRNGVWDAPIGSCNTVCAGPPPAELLHDGAWPASCSGSTLVSATCHAACDNHGAATITCGPGGVWDVSSFRGECKPPTARAMADSEVCAGLPPPILNGRFPDSCADAIVGDECFAVCDPGYMALGEPASACEGAGGTAAAWSTPDPLMCAKGAVKNGTAFIVSEDNNAVIICYLRNGRLFDCVASAADVGETVDYPLWTPLGIAVLGDHVWISDRDPDDQYSRVRVCKWSGTQILSCKMTLAEYYGAGQLVVDAQRDILFHVLNDQACVLACKGIYTLDEECVCTTAPGIDSGFPFGMAVGYGHLWVTSINGLVKCPLDDSESGFDWAGCKTIKPKDEAGKDFMPSGILVDATGAGKVYMADGLSRMMICSTNLTGCITSNGTGTFSDATPGLTGLALSGGYLFVPLMIPGGTNGASAPALSVCKTPGSASTCRLRTLITDPPQESTGSVNVVVVPPPGRRRAASAIQSMAPTQVKSASAVAAVAAQGAVASVLRGVVQQPDGTLLQGRAAANLQPSSSAVAAAAAEDDAAAASSTVAAAVAPSALQHGGSAVSTVGLGQRGGQQRRQRLGQVTLRLD